MDARFAHAPRKTTPHHKSGLFSWGWQSGGIGVKNHGIPCGSLCNLEKYHADFPQKTVEEPKWGCHWLSSPYLCKITSFSPNFSVGEKCQKTRIFEVSSHSKLVGFTPFLGKKKFLPAEKLSQRSDFTLSCLATRGTRLVGTRTDLPESTALFWWGKRQLTQQYTTKI